MSYYSTSNWRRLSRQVKERDGFQCQVCGDRMGDPYCVLHAHHIIPYPLGPNVPENVITLCDLCHAVVTPWWRPQWFRELTQVQMQALEEAHRELVEFLALAPDARSRCQADLWACFGITRAVAKGRS